MNPYEIIFKIGRRKELVKWIRYANNQKEAETNAKKTLEDTFTKFTLVSVKQTEVKGI
jgi:hypothetical protein